jgi:hypothetical protein
MVLIIWYVALVAAGDVLAYFVGRFAEYEWGDNPLMIVFLTMYFLVLWIAWPIAVRLSAPKQTAT